MPSNRWNYHVPLSDLFNGFDETQMPFEPVRDAVVARLREHPFRTEHAGDIVLRALLNDLAAAGTLEQFNRELNYLRGWADQPRKDGVAHDDRLPRLRGSTVGNGHR